jgi:hypothetical protein
MKNLTARWLLPAVASSVLILGFLGTSHLASAYSYTTSGYYLYENDRNNGAYGYHTVQYGDWNCTGSLCSVPISAMLQYVNIWYTSESFSCWFQEVYTFGLYNFRPGNRTTDFYSTPFYNWQYSWGYADSFSGDQTQIVTLGDESQECHTNGSAGGLHFLSAIVRNSSSAYTISYGW